MNQLAILEKPDSQPTAGPAETLPVEPSPAGHSNSSKWVTTALFELHIPGPAAIPGMDLPASVVPMKPAKHRPLVEKVGSVSIPIYPTWRGERSGGPYAIKYYDAAGKRRSTMRAELAEARQFAAQIASGIQKREREQDSLTHQDKARLSFCDDKARSIGQSLEQIVVRACDEQSAREAAGIQATQLELITFFARHHARGTVLKSVREIVAEFLEAMRTGTYGRKRSSAKYLATLESQLDLQPHSFAKHFDCRLQDVTRRDLESWLGAKRTDQGKPISGYTWRNYRTTISAVRSFAKSKGYIMESWKEHEHLQMPFYDAIDKTIFTPAQMISFLGAAMAQPGEPMLNFILGGGFAGLRHEELKRIDWADFDFRHRQKVIHVRREVSKTGEERFITMRPNLIAWLKPRRKDAGKFCAVSNSSEALSDLKRTAGIPHERGETRNVLRKTWESYEAVLNPNLEATAGQAGHSQAIARKHYIRAQLIKDARRWVKILPFQSAEPANVLRLGTR